MITDPVEKIIAEGLSAAGIPFVHNSQGNTKGLDFYLPDFDIYIETAIGPAQLDRSIGGAENIIVIQGMKAAITFLHLIEPPAASRSWQPISTAPKDGSYVDLWASGERFTDCRWGSSPS